MGGSESKDERKRVRPRESSGTAMAAGAIASLAICAVGAGVASLMGNSSKSSGRKTMKAPGRAERIFRDEFAKDPAAYFRDLRKK